jgi:hypothetical protein
VDVGEAIREIIRIILSWRFKREDEEMSSGKRKREEEEIRNISELGKDR